MTIRQLFIIDPRVSDYASLMSNLPEGSEWVLLEGTSDGVQQLQDILANYRGLDAIQIVSHGKPGAMCLGSSIVNSGNLHSYAGALPAIGASLSETGCLLWRRRTGRSRRTATAAGTAGRTGQQPQARPTKPTP